MVLSTALFGKPAFKSLVCNGLILAEDGKKMSKRLRNYPVRLSTLKSGLYATCPSLLCCTRVYVAQCADAANCFCHCEVYVCLLSVYFPVFGI